MALRLGAGPPAYPSLPRLVVGAPWTARAQRPPRTSRPTRAALIGQALKEALVKARAFLCRNATGNAWSLRWLLAKTFRCHGWRELIGAADADFSARSADLAPPIVPQLNPPS